MLVAQGVCKQYRDRNALFEALNDFFRQMRLNIGFQKQKIKEILNQATLKKSNKEIYTAYLAYLEKGQPLDLNFVRILDDTEYEQVANMLRALCKHDASC